MDASRFDALSPSLIAGFARRRDTLRLLLGGALLAVASPAVPVAAGQRVAGRAARRCRRKRGLLLDGGACACASQCQTLQSHFRCHGKRGCFCGEAAAGGGFCGKIGAVNSNGCSLATGEECPTGFTCVVNRGCVASGCEQTSCYAPCLAATM